MLLPMLQLGMLSKLSLDDEPVCSGHPVGDGANYLVFAPSADT